MELLNSLRTLSLPSGESCLQRAFSFRSRRGAAYTSSFSGVPPPLLLFQLLLRFLPLPVSTISYFPVAADVVPYALFSSAFLFTYPTTPTASAAASTVVLSGEY